MRRGPRLLLVGSVLYLLGSTVFLGQAAAASDGWGIIGSVAFVVSSFFFVASLIADRHP